MDDHHYEPFTPDMIAEFDQALAEIDDMIDVFLTVYATARHEFTTAEAVIGLARSLDKRCENQLAACQYLAVAIHHIHELRTTALNIYTAATGHDPPDI